ncbi:MAG TPA: 4Fe-4S cluster-binding domain-containing protein [Candidatus Paceibacterota bacterium]|nr:4Fe-4S cluster-binding domain-containing protein [Candidatus Paceibacterota bacterium]
MASDAGSGDPAYRAMGAACDPQSLPALEGVTFSGGEPFDQASALAVVARAARGMGLSVFIFTGYPWEELQRSVDPGHRALLEVSDLLVAGPYDRNLPCKHPLLASANQQLVFLTDRYRHFDFEQKRKVEFRIGPDGDVRVSGFPVVGTWGSAGI